MEKKFTVKFRLGSQVGLEDNEGDLEMSWDLS